MQGINADLDDEFGDEEFNLQEEHLELKEKLSSIIYSSQEETQHLKKNLDFANLKMHEIKELYKEDQEKHQIIEEELKILKTHFYALEKEKAISDQKLKTMQFKKDNLTKDIIIYKKNNDEMEDTIEKLEKRFQDFEEQIRILKLQIKSHEGISNDRMFQNPNLNLTRISSNISKLLMQSTLKSDSPMSAIKSPIISPITKPIESKLKSRIHKRAQSQQLNFSNKLKSVDEQNGIHNKTDDTSNASSSALSNHKRSISRDQMKKLNRKILHPLLTSSTTYFNKKSKRMGTYLEVVEDTDEKNSTSQCTSTQQNNLKENAKSKDDHKTRHSRDFFQDNDADVSLEFNEDDENLDQKTPLKTIMEPKTKDISEPSVLNMNESEFDCNGESQDIIERDESYLGKSQLFKQTDLSKSMTDKNEKPPASKIPYSPIMPNISALKDKDYNYGIFQIEEENEHSNSLQEYSHEESKVRFNLDNSSAKKKVTTEGDNSAIKLQKAQKDSEHVESKFLNSFDELRDIQFVASQLPVRKDSEMNDLRQINDKLASKSKNQNKDDDSSFDLELRKSFCSDKSDEIPEDNFINDLGINPSAVERKRSSVSSNLNYDQSNRGSLTNIENDKLKQLQSKLSNISRIESNGLSLEADPRFTFQNNKGALFQNAKETFDNVAKGMFYGGNFNENSIRSSSHHKGEKPPRIPVSFGK